MAAFLRRVDHDITTFLIENLMANMILLWMELPGFWKVEHYEMLELDKPPNVPRPLILAANHNSLIDTLFIALVGSLGTPHYPLRKTYTYNKKWRHAPVFGWMCVAAGYISIDTSSLEAKKLVVPKIASAVRDGYSVMVYPQGTRSKRPSAPLQASDVKTGAFRVAAETGVPIWPIRLKGTDQIVNHYGIVDTGTVKITFCRPISGTNVNEMRDDWISTMNGV